MISVAVICLVGAYLGLHYGYLVLVPVTFVAAVVSAAGSAVHGDPISSALLTALTQAIGLQGGYMIGLTGRDLFDQFVARRTRHV
jgi:hypothetical protein